MTALTQYVGAWYMVALRYFLDRLISEICRLSPLQVFQCGVQKRVGEEVHNRHLKAVLVEVINRTINHYLLLQMSLIRKLKYCCRQKCREITQADRALPAREWNVQQSNSHYARLQTVKHHNPLLHRWKLVQLRREIEISPTTWIVCSETSIEASYRLVRSSSPSAQQQFVDISQSL